MIPNPNTILGISFGHGDSSAALIQNGCLVAAAEEERFNRRKHYALFPVKSIQYCLDHACIDASQIDAVAIAKLPNNASYQKAMFFLRHPGLLVGKSPAPNKINLASELEPLGLGRVPILRFEHHLAHMMSARILSPASEMALFSFDGLGDFVSAAMGRADGNKIQIQKRMFFPDSLGFFYTALTQYAGFPYFGDEFKVMGLSSYGEPRFIEALRSLTPITGKFSWRMDTRAFPLKKRARSFYVRNGQPYVDALYDESVLQQILKISPRNAEQSIAQVHRDLAKSIQLRFEEIANHLLTALSENSGITTLGLAGGCSHNSVWVGKIRERFKYKEIFVAPASHDAGIAVGAAALSARTPITCEEPHWGLLGPSHLDSPMPAINLQKQKISYRSNTSESEWIGYLASQLAIGKIIGVFRGRMEFGPRALGSRSILADPRSALMKDLLNTRVKHRETFRPFAASVLYEHQDAWFENAFYAPTMEAVFKVRKEKVSDILGVAHADNSCRIQSVVRDYQPFFWELIETFRKQTGIPMLINTSFNDSEPIVCTQADALRCFETSHLDILVLGDQIIEHRKRDHKLSPLTEFECEL